MLKLTKKYLNVPLYIWVGFFLSIPLFLYLPTVDLFVSHLFYNDGVFFLYRSYPETFFHDSIRPIIFLAVVIPLVATIYNSYTQKNILSMTKRKLLYIILVITLAPGLIVNFVLKENFERPRPKQTIEFGGKYKFYPAYTFTHQGKKSFSSAHVAAAFSLMGIALLAQKRRKFWMMLTLLYAVGMMIARVAAGAHFFSDVVTSFFIVYIANNILYYYLIEEKETT